MPASNSSTQSRNTLLREMSRNIGRPRNASRQQTRDSTFSTLSVFDPENEALMSTQRIDDSLETMPLPTRNVSQKESQHEEAEPDYAIDTSMIAKALPHFSSFDDGSSVDEDDEMSIEIGRGGKKMARLVDDSRNSSNNISLLSSQQPSPSMSRVRNTSRKTSGGSNLLKDAQLRRASAALKDRQVSTGPAAAKSSDFVGAGVRKTLAEMHAKVSENYDGSMLLDERPPTTTVTARSTRFTKSKPAENGTYESNFTGDSNGRSFVLPDLPNLSELVSGVFDDGTPVFSRHTKAKATRFGPAAGVKGKRGPSYAQLAGMPVPEDEKAIFVSLQLLQEKVARLEVEKAEAEKKSADVQQENIALKAQQKERRRYGSGDSAIGSSDDGEDRGKGRWIVEKTRLEAANQSMQTRLEAAVQKAAIAEATVKNLSQERDSAISQLGVAYYTTEEVKAEKEDLAKVNEALRKENEELKAELARLKGSKKIESKRRPQKESTYILRAKELEERAKKLEEGARDLDQEAKELRELAKAQNTAGFDMTEQITQTGTQAFTRRRAQMPPRPSAPLGLYTPGGRSVREIHEESDLFSNSSDFESELVEESIFSTAPETTRNTGTRNTNTNRILFSKAKEAGNAKELEVAATPNVKKVRPRVEIMTDDEDTADLAGFNDTEPVATQHMSRVMSNQDLTFLDVLDPMEIARVRQLLERERANRKNGTARSVQNARPNVLPRANSSNAVNGGASRLTRKSSMKSVRSQRAASVTRDVTATGALADDESFQPKPASRRHSDGPAERSSSRGRRRLTNDVTSAFILPDVTFNQIAAGLTENLKLSETAQKALDSAVQHESGNCVICKQVIAPGQEHSHTTEVKKDIAIPKPVPVSERMPDTEDATMRPSQPPSLALATVMKALEDELAHLKIELASYQAVYNKHDASLSKKQRKKLHFKCETLMRAIDAKADQIYALYDVLESQKEDGYEFTERELEDTLEKIGVDVSQVLGEEDKTGRTGISVNGIVKKFAGVMNAGNAMEEELSDEESELPPPAWDGFESTGEIAA